MKKVVTLGEIMMRLQPPDYKRFLQAKQLEIEFGGGEANVAISLAQFGHHAFFVTKLPQNAWGDAALFEVRKWGVDTSFITRGGERLGIYFCEKGASQRASQVIYDRAHSAISEAKVDEFDWKAIFAGASWFHFTGITPALSDHAAEMTLLACEEAHNAGAQISCDLNYRKKLWTREKADRVMSSLMPMVDVLICNEEDPYDIFGIRAAHTSLTGGALHKDGYTAVAKELVNRFGFKKVAITLRQSLSASINNWSAMIYDGQNAAFSKEYQMQIVDRVGGGDAFGAGLLHGLLTGEDDKGALEFAVAASCLKHSIAGDLNIVSIAEIKSLRDGDGSGRVQR